MNFRNFISIGNLALAYTLKGGKERTRGDQSLLGALLLFGGILKFLPLPQKELCGGN